MDRTFKVYSRPNCLYAELTFGYDRPGEVSCRCVTYGAYESGTDDEPSWSVYKLGERELHLPFQRCSTRAELEAYDRALFARLLKEDLDPALTPTFAYEEEPQQVRYFFENHLGFHGMADIRFDFLQNTKELRYYSGHTLRDDWTLQATALDSNSDCMLQVPLFERGEPTQLNLRDARKIGPGW